MSARFITRLAAFFRLQPALPDSLWALAARRDDHLLRDIGLDRADLDRLRIGGPLPAPMGTDTAAPGSRVATRAQPC